MIVFASVSCAQFPGYECIFAAGNAWICCQLDGLIETTSLAGASAAGFSWVDEFYILHRARRVASWTLALREPAET